MTRAGEFLSRLEKQGFRVIPWTISRRSLNPLRELHSFLQVLWVYRLEEPDVVHHVALKPVVYGGLAVRLRGAPPSVNTVTGLGPVFTNSSFSMRILRRLLTSALKAVFGAQNCRVVLQNEDDQRQLVNHRVTVREKTALVQGFGVDTTNFLPLPEESSVPLVMLPARMLWEKGVREFVAAAEQLRKKTVPARMVLVGAPDLNNPGCIPEEQLRKWVDSGAVEWWGHHDNMPSVLCQAHIVCLPSYREGFPKVLLEAGACGRAVITTDVPGCRQAVSHEVNGLLVPPRDSKALGDAIERLLVDPVLRQRLAAKGRERAVKEFSCERIVGQIMHIYRGLLGEKWPWAEGTFLRGEMQGSGLVRS